MDQPAAPDKFVALSCDQMLFERADAQAPKVSIVIVTCNHEPFCREAVLSVLEQKVDFKTEIVVADDGSTDRTVPILQHLLRQAPNVRFLPSETRLGISANYRRAFASCRGDYVAVLEGDDVWTSPTKLADQVAVLDAHKELSMVFSQILVRDEVSCRIFVQPEIQPSRLAGGVAYFSSGDLAYNNLIGNFSSCIYRRSVISAVPEVFYQTEAYDWLFNIFCGELGAIGCLPGVRTVYRQHRGGQWSSLSQSDKKLKTLSLIKQYDRLTNHRYRLEFKQHARRLKRELRKIQEQEWLDSIRWRRALVKRTKSVITIMRDTMPPLLFRALCLLVPPFIARYFH
jgi:glycosyltransferase involved in cell wall biosynthesis